MLLILNILQGLFNMGTFIFLLGILAAIGVVYPLLVITGIIKDK
jgi:hypothetical protein